MVKIWEFGTGFELSYSTLFAFLVIVISHIEFLASNYFISPIASIHRGITQFYWPKSFKYFTKFHLKWNCKNVCIRLGSIIESLESISISDLSRFCKIGSMSGDNVEWYSNQTMFGSHTRTGTDKPEKNYNSFIAVLHSSMKNCNKNWIGAPRKELLNISSL